MSSPLSRVPWAVSYVARRTAGVSLLLAERVGVAVFPSAPPDPVTSGWAAGYAAGTLDALTEAPSLVATAR
jgi:hypothetical protein